MAQQFDGWNNPDIRFGTSAEWQHSGPGTLVSSTDARLLDVLNVTFVRTLSTLNRPEKADVLLFFRGRQCVDDFFEILIL